METTAGLVPALWTAAEYHQHLLVPVGRAVIGMERQGIPVDCETLRGIESDMAARAVVLHDELRRWTGGLDVNWNSPKQLIDWLHGTLGLPESPYCKKGSVADDKTSTDDRALEWIGGHSAEHRKPIQALRMLRQVERMGRYARDWLANALPYGDGTMRLHPSFGLASDHDNRPGAVTGRFGVKNPALNQVPRNPAKDPAGMRRAFVAPPGMRLIVVDYSQLEVVIMAHLIATLFGADDDPLVMRVRQGHDIHGPLARFIFGELANDAYVANAEVPAFKTDPRLKQLRELAKAGIYGNNYGKGERGFADSLFLPDGEPLGKQRAALLVDGMRQFYPGVFRYQDFIRTHIERTGSIMSLFGRWQPMPLAKSSRQGDRNRAWRQSLNYPMQAGGQEIMALALTLINDDPLLHELGYVLSLVVHDEVVGWAQEATCERALTRVEELMVTAVKLLAPLKAEGHTGTNWSSAK